MELTMNQAVLGVERSGIRVFTQLARQTPGCMALTLGEPDFDTAPAIRAAAKAALDQGDTHYPENNGRPWLKEAIADFERRRNGLSYQPDENHRHLRRHRGHLRLPVCHFEPGRRGHHPHPGLRSL